jgi:hypothetical protein
MAGTFGGARQLTGTINMGDRRQASSLEALGARAGAGCEPQPSQASRPQPLHHRVVQPATKAAFFMRGGDEQSPDIAVDRVADRERDDLRARLDQPASSGLLNGRLVVGLGDDTRHQAILMQGMSLPHRGARHPCRHARGQARPGARLAGYAAAATPCRCVAGADGGRETAADRSRGRGARHGHGPLPHARHGRHRRRRQDRDRVSPITVAAHCSWPIRSD